MTAAHGLEFYQNALIVLAIAGIVVPIMHRINVTPVLGYLCAGAALGPKGLGALSTLLPPLGYVTITDEADLANLAELGIVFLLFLVGLELSTERLITMRRLVFGLGGLQLLVSAAAIGLIAPLFGNAPAASLLIGLSLALSSTAVVLEWLSQEKKLATGMGRAAFAVLLLQDLAVVPILIVAGMVGPKTGDELPGGVGMALLQAAGMLALIILVGRVVLRPLFRLVSLAQSAELFMAATLLVAIGSGVLTALAGLSMALGGFVAGLLLAETEYRRAIAATIEPFKGLLLGVFFVSIGMRIDLVAIAQQPLYVLACAAGLVALKAAIVVPLGQAFGLTRAAAIELGLLLGPGGEFAFIVIGIAAGKGLMAPPVAGVMLAVVALTMAAVPALGRLGERIAHHLTPAQPLPAALLEVPPADGEVRAIVVGAGRVGRLVARLLAEHKVPHILTDHGANVVLAARNDGLPVFYGDAKSEAFLRNCGIMQADALIVTIGIGADIDSIVAAAHELRPELQIVARARDAAHARRLYARGVTDAVPETIEASLQLSEAALVALGRPMGLVIASIHEQRDVFRRELQASAGRSRIVRGLRSSARKPTSDPPPA